MAIDRGFMTSETPTIDDTETELSLIASSMMCEWQSMMPGMTYLPEPSRMVAPAGAAILSPMAAIFPSWRRIEPLIVPLVTVKIVAFWMSTGGSAANAGARQQRARSVLIVRRLFRRDAAPAPGVVVQICARRQRRT